MNQPIQRCWRRFASTTLVLALLAGCNSSGAQIADSGHVPPQPTLDQLKEAVHTAYVAPQSARSECLGRLIFDLSHDMEWGLNAPGKGSGDRYRFTESMHGGHDDLWTGSTRIVVMSPATRQSLNAMLREGDAEKGIAIQTYEDKKKTLLRINANSTANLKNPEFEATPQEKAELQEEIEQYKSEIADIDARVARIRQQWHPLDLGLPNSLGYVAGPDLYAFVWHDGRAFKFLSAHGEGDPPFDERLRAFLDLLKRFQFRDLYEIPTERGICVPYGFIPDDGTRDFRIGISMRFADQPGVIYTIGTGVVGEQGVDGSEPSLLKAIGRAGGAGIGALSGARDIHRIGPRRARIGALPAEQGGMAMNVADPGDPVVHGYSIYTGYGGWGHSRVLPYITVDMRTFNKEQEPSLTVNPPPLEQSMQRYDELLKSIRLRPTTPPMPELLNQSK